MGRLRGATFRTTTHGDSGETRLKVLQIVSCAAGGGERRSVGGFERLMLESLRCWDYTRVRLVVAYPREGRLWGDFREMSDANPAVELVEFATPRRRDFGALPALYRLIRERNIGLVHSQGPHGADWWAATAARLAGIPAIVTRAYALEDYQLPWKTELRFRLTDRLALSAAAHIVFDSDTVRRRAVAAGDCGQQKTRVIPNGIVLERFAADTTARSHAPPTFGMVAQLLPVKHWDGFIEAAERVFKEIPDAVALVIGDGPERERLERVVREKELEERITFAGFHSNVAEVLRKLDVFVLSSLREGLPVAVIEAMAMARPVVVTDVGGIRELVEDGSNGYLVAPRDSVALAGRIADLLRDPDRRVAFGTAARRTVEERFSLETTVKAYQNLYLDRDGAREPTQRKSSRVRAFLRRSHTVRAE